MNISLSDKKLLVAFFLLSLCFATYGCLLGHEFMIDDASFANSKNIPAFYVHFSDFFTKVSNHHYTPLYNILNVFLFNTFKYPSPIYFLNILLFYSNCLFLFILTLRLSRSFYVAFLTSVLFCIHPMSADIIQHITFNNILLSILLMELSLIALDLYLESNKKIFYIGSILAIATALLFHEICILFPLYAATLLWFRGLRFNKILKLCIPFAVLVSILIILWLIFAGHETKLIERFDLFKLNFWILLASFSYLISWYIGNLIAPHSIVMMLNIKPVQDLVWLWNIGFFICLAGLIFLFFKDTKRSIKSFALMIFFTGFLIAIPTFMSRPDMGLIVEPYWFHFSSLGFYLLLALILVKLKSYLNGLLYFIFISSICLFFFINTQKINSIAKTEFTYAKNWLEKSPGNTIAIMILSTYYSYTKLDIPLDFKLLQSMVDNQMTNNNYEGAIKLTTKILTLQLSLEEKEDILCKQAVAYFKLNDSKKYQETINTLINFDQTPFTYILLSSIFEKSGDLNKAIDILNECLLIHPRYKDALLLGGMILAKQEHFQESIEWWKKGQKIDPTDIRFKQNIAKAQTLLNSSK